MRNFHRVIAASVLFAVQGCQALPVIKDDPDTVARLRGNVLPEVEFNETATSDVLEFFHFSSLPIGYKPPPMRQEIRRNEIVYFLPVPDLHDPRVTPPGVQQEEGGKKRLVSGPLITLSASGVSLLELFQRIAYAAKGGMVVRPDLVIIRVPLSGSNGDKSRQTTNRNK